jgi:hypothetical protein
VFAVSEVVRLLVFPLVVLLAGAVISGFLIPALTRRRDDYRKTLEIKTDIVSEMSEAVTEFILAIQFSVLGAHDQEGYNEAYRSWEIRSAVIGTKLEAYFPGTSVGSEWTAFAQRLERFYAITGMGDTDLRRTTIDELLGRYGLSGADAVARAVSAGRPSTEDQFAWGALRDALQDDKSTLIRNVLDTDTTTLSRRRRRAIGA